jgi:bacterioferritin
MEHEAASSELLSLLNTAIARELQVSIQYMFQHAIGAGLWPAVSGKTRSDQQRKFISSHSLYLLPGATPKKIAIAEMRHAEAIAERVVSLGGEPTTQPDVIVLGSTIKEMLETDRAQERAAIDLYGRIVDVAGKESDDVTMSLFRRILSDEERHHRVFSDLLRED